ncbi:sugar transferase, partial [Campylobacter jejuni]|nr:sugar transferase [Campylobacter jejuni]
MKKNKIILSARADGFGERILAMLNAMFVSQVTDYKFGYIWYFDKKNYLGNKTILLSHDYLDEEEKIFNPEFRGKYSFKNKLKDNFGNNIIFSYGIFHKNRCYSFEKLKNGY